MRPTQTELIRRNKFPTSPEVGLLRQAIYEAYAPGTAEYRVAHETLSKMVQALVMGTSRDQIIAEIREAGAELQEQRS